MAYYEPRSDDAYYDPRKNVEQDIDPISSLASAAKSMIGYQLVYGIASAAVGFLGKGVAKGIRRAVPSSRAPEFARRMARYKSPRMSDVAKSISSLRPLYASALKTKHPYRQALAKRSRHIKSLRQTDRLAANKAVLTTLKDKKTFIGALSATAYKHAIAGSTMFYAIDTVMGHTDHMGIEKKPVYDLPGHVMNYAQYLKVQAPWFAAFGVAGPAFKSLHGSIGVGARGFLDKNDKFREHVLKGVSTLTRPFYGKKADAFKEEVVQFQSAVEKKFVTKAMSSVKATWGTFTTQMIENARTYFTEARQHISKAVQHKDSVGGTSRSSKEFVQSLLHDTREIWRMKREAAALTKNKGLADIPGMAVLDAVTELSTSFPTQAANISRRGGGGPDIVQGLVRHNEQIKPKSFLASVLRMKPTRLGDVVSTRYISQVSERMAQYFPDGSTEPLKQALSKVYMGKHFFKKGKFHADLSYFSPLANVKRLVNKIGGINFNLPVGIPPVGRNISLGSIIGADTFLSEETRAATFRSSTTGLGLIVGSGATRHPTGTGVKQHNGPVKNLKELVRDSYRVGEDKVVGSDFTVTQLGRQFYAVDGTDITPLSSKETILKYSHASIFGMAGEGKTASLRNWMYHNNKEIKAAGKLNILEKMYNRGEPSNPFNSFQRKLDWEPPRYARNLIGKFKNLFTPGRVLNNGKQLDHNAELMATAAEGILGKDLRKDGLHEHIQALYSLYGQTSQEVSVLLKRPTVFNELASKSLSNLVGDASIMHSDATFMDVLKNSKRMLGGKIDPESTFYDLISSPEVKSIYNTALYYPSKAREHMVFQRHGRLSQLSSMDFLKVKYVSSVVDRAGGPQSFVDASDHLLARNQITPNQAKALKTHGYLSTLFRDGRLSNQSPVAWDAKSVDMVKDVVSKYKDQHSTWLQDIIHYVSDTDLREPVKKFSMQRMILGETHDAFRLSSEFQSLRDASPFVAFSMDPKGQMRYKSPIAQTINIASERLTNLVGDLTGLKKNPFKFGNGLAGQAKYITTRMGQAAGALLAYRTLDSIVAADPLFDRTSLDAGVTGFVADNIAKTHLATSRVSNFLGISQTARHLEGLMPGFTSSAPGAIIGGAMGWNGGALGVVGGVVKGAIANRVLSPLMPDMTKTYEQLRSEYSGESDVPIIDNKMWFLGTTPWQGRGVTGWQPNWYMRNKSRWQSTDTLYGSEFRKWLHEPIVPLGVSIGDFVDPYYLERKHYFSRPYPESADFGQEAPLGIGPIIAGTIGKVLKPKKLMHREFLDGHGIQEENPVSAIRPPSYPESRGMMMTSTFNPRKFSQRSSFEGTFVYSGTKMYGQSLADQALDDFENALGLAGFAEGSMRKGLSPKPLVLPTLETAGRIASQSRAYYDMNLGGLGIFTEGARRFVHKPDWKRYGVNPIPNLFPQWLGERFTKGDPMSKLIHGELRMPGKAYQVTHPDLKQTMPGRASMIGGTIEHTTQYFTGLLPPNLKEEYDVMRKGDQYHEMVQNWLASENMLIKAESLVYDVKNDITGHVDAIIRDGQGGRGKRALEIKTISDEGILKLKGPKYQHRSQINFYLNQLNLKKGSIMYINRDNPSDFRLYEVRYDHDRYIKDLEKLQKARGIASQMLAKGIEGDGYGHSYSWLDRMKILADINPTSDEYKEARYIVEKQIKSGLLKDKEIAKYRRVIKQRKATVRKYETYPTRFRGKIMSPDSETNIQSLNENIKAAKEYSLPERIIGASWEEFVNTNQFLVNKFLAFKDPLEHYKQYQLYGKEYTPWTDPYGSFIVPGTRTAMSQTDPVRGALSWGIGAPYMLGGRAGGVYGAIAGGLYGAVHGLTRKAVGKASIPDTIQKERDINDYFDQLKYYKNKRMEALSGDLNRNMYSNRAHGTLTGIQEEGGSYVDYFRAASHREKPYIEPWLNETNPGRRDEILRTVPESLGHALRGHWHQTDSKEDTSDFVKNTSNPKKRSRAYTRQEMDPNIMLEDVKLKTINKAGLNVHDFGLGWQDQMMRTQNDLDRIEGSDVSARPMNVEVTDVSAVKAAAYALLNKLGIRNTTRVYVNNHADDDNNLTVVIQREKLQEMKNALNNRGKWMSYA